MNIPPAHPVILSSSLKVKHSLRVLMKYSALEASNWRSISDTGINCSWNPDTSLLLNRQDCDMGLLSTIPSSVRQRESATYTCPKVKADAASMITLSNVSPWLLWIVTAHAARRGYCEKVPSTLGTISLVSLSISYWMFSHFSMGTLISSPFSSVTVMPSS